MSSSVSLLWNLHIKYIWSTAMIWKLWCPIIVSSKSLNQARTHVCTQTQTHTHTAHTQMTNRCLWFPLKICQFSSLLQCNVLGNSELFKDTFVLSLIMHVKISKGIPLHLWGCEGVSSPIVSPLC